MTRHHSLAVLALSLLVALPVAAGAQGTPPADPPQVAAPPAPAPARRMPPASGSLRPRPSPARETLQAIRERGVLRACVSAYMPWVIAAPQGQPISGFAVDVARQLADDMGVDLQFVHTNYRDLVGDLFEGACDVIPGGLAATPERALFVHFSDPIAEHAVKLVGALNGATTLGEFDKPGVAVGAVDGTVEMQDARRLLPKADLRPFPSQAALGDALMHHAVQVAVVASPFSDLAEKLSAGAVKALPAPLSVRRESIAVRRGDLEFLEYLNRWVQAHDDHGWLETRRTRWFDHLEWYTATH
ncbi:transporter substrate-binding domain-containing protein [Luteitalea sp.]